MLKALLFDLDGTIADSDHLHHAAFARLLAPQGIALSASEFTAHILGKPNAEIMDRYFPGMAPREHRHLADGKEAEFRALLAGAAIRPIAGLARLLDWADGCGIPGAVVTNAPRANAEAMLAALGITDRFRAIIIGEECSNPKPDPAPYRAAMAALGVTPADSVAFEDAPSGLRAASGSGAFVFGLRTSLDDHSLRQAGAHATLADYTDPLLWTHLEAFAKETA